MTIDKKIEDIIKRGYSIRSNYKTFRYHRITAFNNNAVIIGSVNEIHKKLYGY